MTIFHFRTSVNKRKYFLGILHVLQIFFSKPADKFFFFVFHFQQNATSAFGNERCTQSRKCQTARLKDCRQVRIYFLFKHVLIPEKPAPDFLIFSASREKVVFSEAGRQK